MRLRNRVVSEQPLHHNNSVVTPPPEKTTISTVAVEDCRETDADWTACTAPTKPSDWILMMSKSDLSSPIKFFIGKECANQIIKEKI